MIIKTKDLHWMRNMLLLSFELPTIHCFFRNVLLVYQLQKQAVCMQESTWPNLDFKINNSAAELRLPRVMVTVYLVYDQASNPMAFIKLKYLGRILLYAGICKAANPGTQFMFEGFIHNFVFVFFMNFPLALAQLYVF